MSAILFILGLILFYWFISGAKSPWSKKKYNGFTGSTNSRNSTTNTVSVPTTQTPSVSPTEISTSPNLTLSVVDGQYRVFQNYIVNGTQYTYGFPKRNCFDTRVWIGIGSQEIERITFDAARNRIRNQSIPALAYNPNDDIEDDLPF